MVKHVIQRLQQAIKSAVALKQMLKLVDLIGKKQQLLDITSKNGSMVIMAWEDQLQEVYQVQKRPIPLAAIHIITLLKVVIQGMIL